MGCGRISAKHFDAIYHNRAFFELVAACDSSEHAKDNVPTDTPFYTDLLDMLRSTKPDMVVLCTPSGMHPREAILSAENGCHVITEKPMATRWKDGLNMIKTFDEYQKCLFVIKQNRLNPLILKVKEAIERGWFGRIHHIQSNVFWTRPQSYYNQNDWRGTWEFDGGALMNQASHYVDLLEWLGGPVESVQAMMATQAREIEVEDSAVVNIQYRGGALGAMSVSMLAYPSNFEGSMTILGENGIVKIGGIALSSVEDWQFRSSEATRLEDIRVIQNSNELMKTNGHIAYYQNVMETLQGNQKAIASGREGLRSLELLVACYKSNQTKSAVHLPLEL